MAHDVNRISAPQVDPSLSEIANLAKLTPGEARWLNIAASLAIGQFTDDQIHPEVLNSLDPGDKMYFLVPHPKDKDLEELEVVVARNTADTITNWDPALRGLKRLGLLRAGSLWEDYRARDVVTIYSEPHGAVRFGFDTETGKRFMPEDIEGIHPGRGWSIVKATEIVGLEISFSAPDLGKKD